MVEKVSGWFDKKGGLHATKNEALIENKKHEIISYMNDGYWVPYNFYNNLKKDIFFRKMMTNYIKAIENG